MEKDKLPIDALFLPFMQMMTGHHHVADALIDELQNSISNLVCDKVDILSFSYGRIEKVISSIYLAWIKVLPNVYDKVYYKKAYNNPLKNRRYVTYELFFTHYVKRLVQEKKPRIIFCTHAFPSYILSVLKQKGKINCLVVNVYTDFFINNVWGTIGIDFHLVPSFYVKECLLKKRVSEDTIFITGIPVHPIFKKDKHANETKTYSPSILVTGGSLGVGPVKKVLLETKDLHYYVLCGENRTLYEKLVRINMPNITPYRYINSRKRMNELYDKVDGVLTKPGGVTISECLMKRKPIFIYNLLPGQEKINMKELKRLGLVIQVGSNVKKVERKIISFFNNIDEQKWYKQQVEAYLQHIVKMPLSFIFERRFCEKTLKD